VKLFEPVQLGTMTLKNRIVFPPVLTKYATEEGFVTDPLIEFYRERAKGGAGLIIVESAYIDPLGKFARKMPGICEDKFLPGLERLRKAVHSSGAKIAIELFHAGRQTTSKIIYGQPVSPSGLACPVTGEKPRVLSIEEVRHLIDQYSEAAKRAREAGFDTVEFDAGYGHLITQFLSPHTNQRGDGYGGDFNGRMRFAKEILLSTREKVGREYPILFRLNGDDLLPGGNRLEDAKEIARALEELGVSGLDIVAGIHESRKDMDTFSKHSACPGSPFGVWIPLARGIKEVVSLPVIAGGRINDPDLAESILQKSDADLIALGRALIADPEFPQKAAEGRAEEIRRCVGCGTCQKRDLGTGLTSEVTCLVNAEVGREGTCRVAKASRLKRVVIVGGGVGGMEAARVATLRGYHVTLFEKSDRLGGQVRLSTNHPLRKEMEHLLHYLEWQMEKLPVGIHLNQAVTAPFIQSLEFDALVFATGAKPVSPEIPGIDEEGGVFAHQILTGEVAPAERVVVGGGGLVGAEVADRLAERGKRVVLVEMLDMLMSDDGTFFRPLILHRLRQHRVQILTGATVKEIQKRAVIIEKEGERIVLDADQFVIAMGYQADRELYHALEHSVDPDKIFLIGDCSKPRKAVDAIFEGHQVGLSI
jgi:2,4-dienoyl-CoA reductase-like NADH-dependent reductase (Old Yellow Enzyme family)/thioredoxin reductase